MTVGICDDDEKIRKHLVKLVRSFTENIPVQTEEDKEQKLETEILDFADGTELLAYEGSFDIVIMDIDMKETNGLDAAKKLRETSDAILIFVTAWKEYVFNAFDLEAFHYLLKPLDEQKFLEVLQKAFHKLLVKEERKSGAFTVKTLDGFRTVKQSDIYYAENIARKIVLHTKQGSIAYYDKMIHLQEQLGSGFFRCHRGYLVSLDKVRKYDSREIELVNGDKVLLSRQKYADFVQAYMDYMVEENG